MRYCVERLIPHSFPVVWSILSDVGHFTTMDSNHYGMVLLTPQRSGVGAKFSCQHRYWPIFPFPEDEVVCTVTVSDRKKKRIVLAEENKRAYRSHTQEYELEEAPNHTLVRFWVAIRDLPPIWSHWVVYTSKRVMHEHLANLEKECVRRERIRSGLDKAI